MAEEPGPSFTGEKTTWHGFDRFDFVMDEATLAITPFKADRRGKATGSRLRRRDNGGASWWCRSARRRGCLGPGGAVTGIISRKPRSNCSSGAFASPTRRLTQPETGPAVGCVVSISHGTAWAFEKARFYRHEPRRRIRVYLGDRHPERWPASMRIIRVVTKTSWPSSGELASQDVPLLHVCGSLDPLLGKYSTPIENIYQQFGGAFR